MMEVAPLNHGFRNTANDVDALPVVLDVLEAARLLGIGRTLAYQLIRTGQWPTPVIRVGRLVKVPSRPLLDYLLTGERSKTA